MIVIEILAMNAMNSVNAALKSEEVPGEIVEWLRAGPKFHVDMAFDLSKSFVGCSPADYAKFIRYYFEISTNSVDLRNQFDLISGDRNGFITQWILTKPLDSQRTIRFVLMKSGLAAEAYSMGLPSLLSYFS